MRDSYSLAEPPANVGDRVTGISTLLAPQDVRRHRAAGRKQGVQHGFKLADVVRAGCDGL